MLESSAAGLDVLDAGVVETRASMPLAERVHAIYDGVWALLEKHDPTAVIVEDLYTSYAFPRTALLMAHARGVICLAAHQKKVDVMTLAPAEVKRAVAAHGAASKEQIQHSVQRLFALPDLPRPSHVADAIALAFTGLGRLRLR